MPTQTSSHASARGCSVPGPWASWTHGSALRTRKTPLSLSACSTLPRTAFAVFCLLGSKRPLLLARVAPASHYYQPLKTLEPSVTSLCHLNNFPPEAVPPERFPSCLENPHPSRTISLWWSILVFYQSWIQVSGPSSILTSHIEAQDLVTGIPGPHLIQWDWTLCTINCCRHCGTQHGGHC